MSDLKQKKKRSPLYRFLKAVFWTAGILVFLAVFVSLAVLFTIDQWIVPFGAWCMDVEIVEDPGVMVSLANREIFMTGLKVKTRAGTFEAKSYGLRVDDVDLDGWNLKEVRVSRVHAEGLRVALDFAQYAKSQEEKSVEKSGDVSSGEKVRTFSHLVWARASKPVVRMSDLTLLDAEIGWQAGAARSRISVSDLYAKFGDGLMTRPEINCGVKYHLSDPQRFLECGGRISVQSSGDGEKLIVSIEADEPLVIDLPDSHLEFPGVESAELVMQYDPENADLGFGGNGRTQADGSTSR